MILTAAHHAAKASPVPGWLILALIALTVIWLIKRKG